MDFDIVGLSLIVPLALSAFAMRGGLLMHTWIYLAASEVAWLLYDVWWALQPPVATNVGTSIMEAVDVVRAFGAHPHDVARVERQVAVCGRFSDRRVDCDCLRAQRQQATTDQPEHTALAGRKRRAAR